MMIYERTWRFSASHLNSKASYDVVWSVYQHSTAPLQHFTPTEFLDLLRDSHGHNFKVRAIIMGDLGQHPWLVDDEKLTRAVSLYDNTNLSLLPYFLANRKRATTEELAMLLWMNLHQVARTTNCSCVRVEVWETDDICATYEPPLL